MKYLTDGQVTGADPGGLQPLRLQRSDFPN